MKKRSVALAFERICFVDCVAGPLLLSFAGFASLVGLSEKIEPLFQVTSLGLGCATLIPAYRKHGRLSCLATFLCGLLCLVVMRRFQPRLIPEVIVVGVGAALIIGAHSLNLKFAREFACCQHNAGVQPESVP